MPKPTEKLSVVKKARYGTLTLEFYGDIRSSDFYITRKAETDVIKEFVEYARLMGSKNADYYYTSLSTLANKSVEIKDRDFTEGEKLHNLHLIERVIAKALREGMGAGRDYHDIFKDAKRRGEQFAELISLQEGA